MGRVESLTAENAALKERLDEYVFLASERLTTIDNLYAENLTLRAQVTEKDECLALGSENFGGLLMKYATLEAQMQGVRDRHRRIKSRVLGRGDNCSCGLVYPCATARALDAVPDEQRESDLPPASEAFGILKLAASEPDRVNWFVQNGYWQRLPDAAPDEDRPIRAEIIDKGIGGKTLTDEELEIAMPFPDEVGSE
jgi:hypothetical protein